jgi:hypothetical protein
VRIVIANATSILRLMMMLTFAKMFGELPRKIRPRCPLLPGVAATRRICLIIHPNAAATAFLLKMSARARTVAREVAADVEH